MERQEQQHTTIDDLCFATGGGAYQTPPLWMKPGDTIEVEITGVGVLRNPIIAED